MSSGEPDPVLVFDAMCLNHFARAERLDVLRDLLVGTACLTTHVVREEIRAGVQAHPLLQAALDADWLPAPPETVGSTSWRRQASSRR